MPTDRINIDLDLKRAVERIVAPIPADPRLKDQFREELLGHLKDQFEKERLDGRDESEAFDEAVQRLGEPATLRTQFVGSLSRLDRFSGRIFYRFERRRYESNFSFAMRGSAFFALGVASFIAALFVPTIAGITLLTGPHPGTVVLLTVLGLFGVVYSTATVFIAFLVDVPAERTRNEGRWLVYTGYVGLVILVSMGTGAFAWLAGHGVAAAVLGARHDDVFMFDCAAAITVIGGAISMIMAALVGGIGEGTMFRSRIPDWPYADDA